MKKVNFFISSTWEDLIDHRRFLLDAFARLKQEVEVMEYWAPDSQSSLELSLEHVRASDIYIGILGTRYGSEPDNIKSITQYEYEEATRLNLKRLVYLIDENQHKIYYKDVDTGEKGLKLKEFKDSINKSIVRAKFSSPEDLASKVITHCIQHLDKIGDHIQKLKDSNHIFNFSAKGAFDISATELAFDVSPFLTLDINGKTTLDNPFLQKVLMGGIIADQLNKAEYACLNGITTFDQTTWNVITCLIKTNPINLKKITQVLDSELDPFKIRLLVALAGEMGNVNMLDPICSKVLNSLSIDSYFKRNKIHISSLYDTAKIAISALAIKESQFLIELYILKATQQQKWKAKQLFESSLNSLKRNIH